MADSFPLVSVRRGGIKYTAAAVQDDILKGWIDDGQVVEVNDRYGYVWKGAPVLQIGESVVLPGARGGARWIGTVTNLGSGWDGEFKEVLRRPTENDILKLRIVSTDNTDSRAQKLREFKKRNKEKRK